MGYDYGLVEIFHAIQSHHQELLMEPPENVGGLYGFDEEYHWAIAVKIAEWQLAMRGHVCRLLLSPGAQMQLEGPRSVDEMVQSHEIEFFEHVPPHPGFDESPIPWQTAVGWPHTGFIGWDTPAQHASLPPQPEQPDIAGPSSQRLDSVSQQAGPSTAVSGEENKPMVNGHVWSEEGEANDDVSREIQP